MSSSEALRSAVPSDKLTLLAREVGRILGLDEVDPDLGIAELGVSSLNVMEMILICEVLYPDITNPEDLEIDAFTTLREIDRQLLEHGRSR